jgi:hypothetical protein
MIRVTRHYSFLFSPSPSQHRRSVHRNWTEERPGSRYQGSVRIFPFLAPGSESTQSSIQMMVGCELCWVQGIAQSAVGRSLLVQPEGRAAWAGRALALAAAIRELVTTDPLIVELLLREVVCWQKGVVAGCNYRRAEYVLQQTAAMRQRMDTVDRR